MITRNIGKLIRGKTTPFQVLSACILGAMLGFVPGFQQGPGLIAALVFLLIILNANLFVAGLAGLLAKAVSLAILPVTFAAGAVLLDGPTQPLFKAAINAPVLALFRLDYYATTGGTLLGFTLGLAVGAALVVAINSIRHKLAGLEESSEKFQQLTRKKWVKVLTFVFVGGGKGKRSYNDLLAKKVGNPIRILGVVLVVLLCALLYVGQALLAEPIVTMALKRGLESANGATVDMKSAKLDVKQGKLTISSLAMADPKALDTDLFRASEVTADVNTDDLLRMRLKLDNVTVADGSSGDKRAVRGHLVGGGPRPLPPPPPKEGEKTIDDYIKEAQLWKDRLAQVRKWIEKASGPDKDRPTEPAKPGEEAKKETLKQRLAREVRENGYTHVTASHLVDKVPTLLVRTLDAKGVKAAQLPGEILDISAHNLSTQPWLVEGKPTVSVATRSNKLAANIAVGGKAAAGQPTEADKLYFKYLGLPTSVVASQLTAVADGGKKPIDGGTIDLLLDGSWSAQGVGFIDLPLQVTLHDTTVSLRGAGSAPVKLLDLPLGLRGPLDNPRILLDGNKLGDALAKAGAAELASRARGEASKAIEKATDKLKDKAGDKAKDLLNKLPLGSKKK